MLGRSHTSSESRVDGTDGARCDDGRFWFLIHRRYLLHDHDSKYSSSFRQVIEAGSVKTLALPPRSPNLNAYAERWVRSVREECLAKLILLGEGSLRRALRQDRKSTRLNSSHRTMSFAVFCLDIINNT